MPKTMKNTGRKVVVSGYQRSVYRGSDGGLYTQHKGKFLPLSMAQKKQLGMGGKSRSRSRSKGRKRRSKSRSRSKGRKRRSKSRSRSRKGRSRSRSGPKRGRTPQGYIRVPSRLRSLPQLKSDLRSMGAYHKQVSALTHRGMMSDLARKGKTHMGGKPMTRGRGKGMYPISGGYDSYRVMYKPRGKNTVHRGYI